MYFSFVLRQKKRYQKKTQGCTSGATPVAFFQLKGRNSLRSNSLPFLTLKILPAFDAPTVRPETIRSDSVGVMV